MVYTFALKWTWSSGSTGGDATALRSTFRLQPSASVVLPLAGGHGDVRVSLVPWEKAHEGDGAVGRHRTGQHVKLRASRTHQGAGALGVDEEPLLDEVLGVVRQQRPLADKLHAALHAELQLARGGAMAVKLGGHGCVQGRPTQTVKSLEFQKNLKVVGLGSKGL